LQGDAISSKNSGVRRAPIGPRRWGRCSVNIGDHLTAQRVREAIRALYATGFFRDVQLRRDGGTLIVVVLERPSIDSFEITGNEDIKTEELQKSLRNVGLAAGKVFDRSVLEDVTQYLTDHYYSRGYLGLWRLRCAPATGGAAERRGAIARRRGAGDEHRPRPHP
jgi:hypothetical protein